MKHKSTFRIRNNSPHCSTSTASSSTSLPVTAACRYSDDHRDAGRSTSGQKWCIRCVPGLKYKTAVNFNSITRSNLVGDISRKIIWTCIVEDPSLFFRHFLEKLTNRERQVETFNIWMQICTFFPLCSSFLLTKKKETCWHDCMKIFLFLWVFTDPFSCTMNYPAAPSVLCPRLRISWDFFFIRDQAVGNAALLLLSTRSGLHRHAEVMLIQVFRIPCTTNFVHNSRLSSSFFDPGLSSVGVLHPCLHKLYVTMLFFLFHSDYRLPSFRLLQMNTVLRPVMWVCDVYAHQ